MNLEQFPVAILAGGLATRMRPMTEKLPKILLPVAGKPFLAWQLDLLRSQGFNHVVLCVGYLGEMVQAEFGDGSSLGLRLEYSHDGGKLLGTGGALRQALPILGEKFFVIYGDSYLTAPFAPIAECFANCGKSALMVVYRNDGRYEPSNVVFCEGQVVVYDKNSLVPEMHHIDYGLSVFRGSVFSAWPNGSTFDLGDVVEQLVLNGELAGFEVNERFHEIGSPSGLRALESFLAGRQRV